MVFVLCIVVCFCLLLFYVFVCFVRDCLCDVARFVSCFLDEPVRWDAPLKILGNLYDFV